MANLLGEKRVTLLCCKLQWLLKRPLISMIMTLSLTHLTGQQWGFHGQAWQNILLFS